MQAVGSSLCAELAGNGGCSASFVIKADWEGISFLKRWDNRLQEDHPWADTLFWPKFCWLYIGNHIGRPVEAWLLWGFDFSLFFLHFGWTAEEISTFAEDIEDFCMPWSWENWQFAKISVNAIGSKCELYWKIRLESPGLNFESLDCEV